MNEKITTQMDQETLSLLRLIQKYADDFNLFLNDNEFQAFQKSFEDKPKGAYEAALCEKLQKIEAIFASFQERSSGKIHIIKETHDIGANIDRGAPVNDENACEYDGNTNEYQIVVTNQSGFALLKSLYHESEHAAQLNSKRLSADDKRMSTISATLYEKQTDSPGYLNNYNEVRARTAEARFCLAVLQHKERQAGLTHQEANALLVVAKHHYNNFTKDVTLDAMKALNNENIDTLTPKKGIFSFLHKPTEAEQRAAADGVFLTEQGMRYYSSAFSDMQNAADALGNQVKGLEVLTEDLSKKEAQMKAEQKRAALVQGMRKEVPGLSIICNNHQMSFNRRNYVPIENVTQCKDVLHRVNQYNAYNPVLIEDNGKLFLSWDDKQCTRPYYPRPTINLFIHHNGMLHLPEMIENPVCIMLSDANADAKKHLSEMVSSVGSMPPRKKLSADIQYSSAIKTVDVKFDVSSYKCTITGRTSNNAAMVFSFLKTMAKESCHFPNAIVPDDKMSLMLKIDAACADKSATGVTNRYADVFGLTYTAQVISKLGNDIIDEMNASMGSRPDRRDVEIVQRRCSQYLSELKSLQKELGAIDIAAVHQSVTDNITRLNRGQHNPELSGDEVGKSASFLREFGGFMCDNICLEAKTALDDINETVKVAEQFLGQLNEKLTEFSDPSHDEIDTPELD